MIDIRKLKELVRLMVENDLAELDLKDKEEQVLVKRQFGTGVPIVTHGSGLAHAAPQSPAAPAVAKAAPAAEAAPADSEAGLIAIESPMVGTFYAAAGPDKAAFVSVGTVVGPDSVVCLIEAMKIFNEIKAERSGTIVKVLVEGGRAVEFGQKLFLVRPS